MKVLAYLFFISFCIFLSNLSKADINGHDNHHNVVLASHNRNNPNRLSSLSRNRETSRTLPASRPSVSPPTKQESNGFNLLWLISSRIHQHNHLRNQRRQMMRRRRPGSRYTRRLFRHGIPLHSNLPRKVLRYHRNSQFSTVQRRVRGGHVGFETQFLIRPNSGSGYLITGKALGERGGKRRNFRKRSSSWFGLYSQVSRNKFSLRLEYKDAGWRGKFSTLLQPSAFAINSWHNLTVQIDHYHNRIEYRVNCTRKPAIMIRKSRNRSHQRFGVYRLLQHRKRSSPPVKVQFKSMIITDGRLLQRPRQCLDSAQRLSNTVCSGGKIFMECGPSCEQTCRSKILTFSLCTLSCVRGCHCPPSQVQHKGVCINTELCPCRIGTKIYRSGANQTINNEICTCFSGRWRCYAAAVLTTTPVNQTVELGRNISLTCAVDGNPLPQIEWITPPGVTSHVVQHANRRTSQLIVSNATFDATGLYTCHASKLSEEWSANASARISVISRPTVTSSRNTVTAMQGTSVSIDCQIKGQPAPRAAWIKKGAKLRYRPVPSGVLRLKISNINVSDAGEYKCVAKNQAGYAIQKVTLLVQRPAPNSMAFRKQPRDRYVREGQTAVFPCQVFDHSSQVNITWFKNGKVLESENHRILKKSNRLVIRRVKRSDAGAYMCVVNTSSSDMHAKANLMIKGQMKSWGSWSPCSRTCGRGFKRKQRSCTGIPPNSKTCPGKMSIRRVCNTHTCPGVCSSYGDPHYTTFDGRQFNFQGDCAYILSQDVAGNTFKIIQYNVGCGSRLSCVQKISVVLDLPNLSAVVDLGRDHHVLLNGVPLALPFHREAASFSIVEVGLYLMLQVSDFLEIRWATPHRLYVIVSGKYRGRTQGLCGNFNGDKTDDKLSPQGRTLDYDLAFGQSWAVKDGNANFSCHAVSTVHSPCRKNPMLFQQARATCFYLLNKNKFGSCHNVVPPNSFISSCMMDICSTSIQKTNMYFCIALSAYADECLRKNVVMNWRSNSTCPIRCPVGMVYSECGPTCQQYCPDTVEGETICLSFQRCVAGCFCPPNRVHHNGACIPKSQCPCQFNGMIFTNGSRHERNCQQCICNKGNWICEFNKKLCNFPASVIKPPHSQVISFGQTVSFCCGVSGIPRPIVTWYFNGEVINATNNTNRVLRNGVLNSTLTLSNVSNKDLGIYTCNASNKMGSHLSHAASLKVFDADMYACNPVPDVNQVTLPDGCYVTNDNERENTVNLGRCSGDPCFGLSRSNHGRISCNPNHLCCQASATSPVLVKCRHHSYVTSFLITIVRECSCVVCAEKTTVVEGVVRSITDDTPVRHVMLSHQGRTVGYTSNAGSFRISFQNLPLATQHVTITVTDVMLKRFSTVVRNLVVVPGHATLHTIRMRPYDIRREFNVTEGFRYLFRPSSGYSHRIKLTIPPNSLGHDRQKGEFNGSVHIGITLVDHERPPTDHHQPLLESPVAIGLNGNELLITPTITISITVSCMTTKRRVDLAPNKYATLSLVSSGMGMKLQAWTLDDYTGYWREDTEGLSISPRYTKSGEKTLTATAKIKKLNTAWSLAIGKTPCYVRARVANSHNQNVPGVKVSFITAYMGPSHRRVSSARRYRRNRKPLLSSQVEGLTGSENYPNGVCLPVGCHDTGILQASQLGNELVLLRPDVPNSSMGRVREMKVMVGIETEAFHNMTTPIDTGHVFNTTNMTSHYAYFRTRSACRNTSPSLQTYVFRDNIAQDDGSLLSSYSEDFQNNVILTFGIPNQQVGSPKPILKYCHVKVLVRLHPTFQYQGPLHVEVVTYRNKTTRTRNSMSFLGWRTVPVKPRTYSRGPIEARYVCIEYLCGEVHLTDHEQIVLRATIRQNNENRTSQSSEIPRCLFSPAQPEHMQYYSGLAPNLLQSRTERDGYLYVHKIFNVRSRSYRTATRREIRNEYSAVTLAESKERCTKSSSTENVSAYFDCS